MMRFVFLLASVTAAMAGGTDNKGFAGSFSSGNGQGYGFSSDGSSSFSPGTSSRSGNGQGGYGYGGSFGGSVPAGGFANSGNNGQGYGYAGTFGPGGSVPPGVPQFDFNNLLTEYFNIFKKYNQDLATNRISAYAYSITNADSNNKVQAKSSLTFHNNRLQNQQNQFGGFGFGFPGGNPAFGGAGFGGGGSPPYSSGGFGGGFSNFGGQGASASASIGLGGAHQTASVYPENPNIPNVNNRFGTSSGGGGGGGTGTGGGSYSVFTSSQSGSSNVNGKPNNYNKASTTINDNGKVTTYTVHNP